MGAASHPSQASVESSAAALRTSLPTAAKQLIAKQNTSTPGEETKQSPATKTEQWRGSRFVLSPAFFSLLFILPGRVKYQRPWPLDLLLPRAIDRSHYEIKMTKIAHDASEKCKTISRSLS